MSPCIPSAFEAMLLEFKFIFSMPTFRSFVSLVVGWVLCVGRHTISGVIRAGCTASGKDFSAFYRFFSASRWDVDLLGRVVLDLVLPFMRGNLVHAIIDDTLCHRSGPQIWGGGMHHDATKSSYARGEAYKKSVTLSFGHSWVILSVWIPLPWNRRRGLAIPVLWRLYRSKKRCPANDYRKRTELASEMLEILVSWLPPDRRVECLGDGEYACRTVVRRLPECMDFVGPVVMDAALFEPPGTYSGKGRPRKKGRRLPSPQELAEDHRYPWTSHHLVMYGRKVRIRVKSVHCLWYTVAGARHVTVVITRDPRGNLSDRAFFSTNPEHGVREIVLAYCRRWSLEVTFRNVKQFLGAEDPQNGWWRRKSGSRRPPRKAGPEPHSSRGKRAVSRTAPFAFVVYGITIAWYLRYGNPSVDVQLVRHESKWYRHKSEPAFADMLASLRRRLWASRLSSQASRRAGSRKVRAVLPPHWLLRAA